MNHDYNTLFVGWQDALVEVAVSFSRISNGVYYKRAVERATGVAQLTQHYPEYVTPLETPTYRNMLSRKAQFTLHGREFDDATAVADTSQAVARLRRFRSENEWLTTAAKSAEGREKKLLQNAARRFRTLGPFSVGLAWASEAAYSIQMLATVEPEYVAALMRQEPSYHPDINNGHAEAIMLLQEADIPLSYSTALLTPKTLTGNGARQVISLYNAGISAEFAGATL